ncbi:MAG: FkbM family methyltransferase [Phycisphaerales bacterium]|nr:FkbM family methyltransferase [Phycisphaerales bacterium]
MAWQGIDAIRNCLDKFGPKRRCGPFIREYRKLVLDLAKLRQRVAGESDPHIREFLGYALSKVAISRSQIFQDAFVTYVLREKQGGFFCDFGSTDGVFMSNSFMLENHFAWKGICAEPARSWHEALRRNRPGAMIETRCVWSESGQHLTFMEAPSMELSTLERFNHADGRSKDRRQATVYEVETISLNDLLRTCNAPSELDYLSIDTEGSELDILQKLDFHQYLPRIITVEHNYTSSRDGILALLTSHGYQRVLPEVSLFDDWYLAPGVRLPS